MLRETTANMYVATGALLLFIALGATAEQTNVKDDCKTITIECSCGIGKTKKRVPLELKTYTTEDPLTGKKKCAGYHDPYQACANISCSLALNRTRRSENGDNFISNFYPQVFTIRAGDVGHRFTRQSDPCHVAPVKNAEIKCWRWPNWINCDVNCIHGYALQSNVGSIKSENINCRLTENVWKPHGFQECEPYVNCKVHLVKPGHLKCKEPTDGPAYCEISCLDYDQYEATANQRYECVDENFQHVLPHCAVLKDKVRLIQKPSK